jgi:hypothetical protein
MKRTGTARGKVRRKPTPPSGSLRGAAGFWDRHDATRLFSRADLVPLRTWTKGRKVRHVYVAPDGSQYELIPIPSDADGYPPGRPCPPRPR